MVKIGINGIGRIGCLAALDVLLSDGVELTAINVGVHTPEYTACVLKNEFNYPGEVRVIHGRTILIAGGSVTVLNYRDSEVIPWGDIGVDYVVDTNGPFTDELKAQAHLQGGAKKVIMAAASTFAHTFVYRVNHSEYTLDLDMVSNANSITNCIAPIAKVLHNNFGIATCHVTAFLSTSGIQKTVYKFNDPASFRSIHPSSGEGMAIGKVIPALEGRVTQRVFDLPTAGVSKVFITVILDNPATYDEIKEAILEESEGNSMGILSFADQGVEIADVVGRSCIFDAMAGVAHGDRIFELVAWHDNDWGYSNRLVDLIKYMASSAH